MSKDKQKSNSENQREHHQSDEQPNDELNDINDDSDEINSTFDEIVSIPDQVISMSEIVSDQVISVDRNDQNFEVVTLDTKQHTDKAVHQEEFAGSLNKIESRLLMMWQDNLRTVPELSQEYKVRWPHHKIAVHSIARHLKSLQKKAIAFNRKSLQQALLFEHEILFKEAYQAWLDSKEDKVTIKTTIKDRGDDGYEEQTSETRSPQIGDPRHWSNALQAMKAIREMAGVDEPKRVEQIIRREMDVVLQYLEKALPEEVFEQVVGALVQYETERDSV